ncbi:MAG: DHH family phosphoesterase [Bacilli bacterium]|nr:DHH family phosphoesterase [Bacilli bacterium]
MSKNSFLEKLLSNFSLSEEEYRQLTKLPSFSSIPKLDSSIEAIKCKKRLEEAKKNNEKVFVYGDYDTDGIMATTISILALRKFGLLAYGYIPSRYIDAYGITPENVEKIAKKGYKLILSVDNGVTAYQALEKAHELGIDVLIIDHHELGETLPINKGLIHPEVISYGEYAVSAGYLSFLFSVYLNEEVDPYLLTLGAVSTLSDMMPLKAYNREIVRLMENYLERDKYRQFTLLTEKSLIDSKTLQMEIIPKINAIGRVCKGVEINRLIQYFASNDIDNLRKTSEWMNDINRQRKFITKTGGATLNYDEKEPGIIAIGDFPEGLNGLLANKLLGDYSKPVCIFSESTINPEVLVGSIRSKAGYNVVSFLESTSVNLLSYGGHPGAAGVSIKKEDYESFKKEFLSSVSASTLLDEENEYIELEIEEATMENYEIYKSLSPYGNGWPEPRFLIKDLETKHFRYVGDRGLLSFVFPNKTRVFSFSLTKNDFGDAKKVDLIVSFDLNEYNGRFTPQLTAKKIKS